jgi:predicted nucleotidyltransferase
MRIAGIVTEYNPLHNGHLYQLAQIRQRLNPDLIVSVMSGDFTQRGEPAIVSKWDRARLALEAGVDLVFELPYVFAVGKADTFARGAVALLDRVGATHLVFSSECGRIKPFFQTLDLIAQHRLLYQEKMTEALSRGISYPNAHAVAFRTLAASSTADLVDLSLPNNSLGYQYVRAIRHRDSDMIPCTMRRKDAAHNDTVFAEGSEIASASSIRRCLMRPDGGVEKTGRVLPPSSLAVLRAAEERGVLTDWETFFPYLKYRLLSTPRAELSQVYEAEEGIENRLLAKIARSDSFHSFISAVKTKRYTWARLQRLCVHILTATKKDEAKVIALTEEPDYLRLLGMSRAGRHYLALIRKRLDIPLITKIRRHRETMLELDSRAGMIYDFLSGNARTGLNEIGHPPVQLEN